MYFLREPSLKPFSSTASMEVLRVRSSVCSQPMSIPTTASICSSPQGQSCSVKPKKVDTFGQVTRLAVVFHRLLMPDGYSVSLDQFKGLNQIGDTGLRDQVNNHYLRIFGVSLAIGAIGAVAEGGTAGSLNASSSDLMRQGFAQGTAQSSAQILDKFLNIMPTVTIREGHRVKVYLSGDLALPDYTNHKMPSDM